MSDAKRTPGVESAVLDRYSAGAKAVEPALCCPVDYDPAWLKAIPQEVLDKDYGCGDPSRHVHEGETVLDLGSGGGKICFIASQKVGPKGRVIGVDMNDDMLALARRHQDTVARTVGWSNVTFLKGRIQDLRLPVNDWERLLAQRPPRDLAAWQSLEEEAERLRREQPLVADGSIDVVVSNCVLNLVKDEDKPGLFAEVFRVLRRGGRAVISDIVSDEAVPAHLRADSELWSGCVSGALTEHGFLKAFEDAGFHGLRLLKRDADPWRTVEGIEFRSVTVEAFKGKQGPCLDRHQAVVYKGPWKAVLDDDGHTLRRGERMAVCEKTFRLYADAQGPYSDELEFVEPRQAVPLEEARAFDCRKDALRAPAETKGLGYLETTAAGACCPADGC